MVLNGWSAFWLALGAALIVNEICSFLKARTIIKSIERIARSGNNKNQKEIAKLLRKAVDGEDDDD